jgi:hypothetical protein
MHCARTARDEVAAPCPPYELAAVPFIVKIRISLLSAMNLAARLVRWSQ